jgi:hypothetical protein
MKLKPFRVTIQWTETSSSTRYFATREERSGYIEGVEDMASVAINYAAAPDMTLFETFDEEVEQ